VFHKPHPRVHPHGARPGLARALLPLSLALVAGAAVLLPAGLSTPARLTLFAFLLAVILWSTTRINVAHVGLSAVMLLILTGGSTQERLYGSLASNVIWLMIGAFILSGAVEKTGLAVRLAQLVVARARTVRSLFWLLTAVLISFGFFIPSVSARAAVAIPIFRSLATATGDRRITRALALLVPTVILVATISTLLGAGSHLVANELLSKVTGQQLSFGEWLLYGLPFGVVASYAACEVIMALFLDRERRRRRLQVPQHHNVPVSRAEWTTLAVGATMVMLWLSERWHHHGIATVTMAGALVLTAPGSVLSWKDGLKAVEWNLILFMGAALVLGGALVDTGASDWVFQAMLAQSGIENARVHLVILLTLASLSLTSHLYIISHTARAATLVPFMLYLARALNLNPVAVLFISTVGMDYCLTFPVSSKALLMFQAFGLETETYQPADLLRLSAVMLLVHLGLIVLFYYTYWSWVGLGL
jgi:anion transporter